MVEQVPNEFAMSSGDTADAALARPGQDKSATILYLPDGPKLETFEKAREALRPSPSHVQYRARCCPEAGETVHPARSMSSSCRSMP